MSRFIEFMEVEIEILEAVLSRRIRSFVLLLAAFVVPPAFLLAAMSMLSRTSLPGLAEGIRPVLGVFAAVLMLKFLILASQTYLKDRAALLKF